MTFPILTESWNFISPREIEQISSCHTLRAQMKTKHTVKNEANMHSTNCFFFFLKLKRNTKHERFHPSIHPFSKLRDKPAGSQARRPFILHLIRLCSDFSKTWAKWKSWSARKEKSISLWKKDEESVGRVCLGALRLNMNGFTDMWRWWHCYIRPGEKEDWWEKAGVSQAELTFERPGESQTMEKVLVITPTHKF